MSIESSSTLKEIILEQNEKLCNIEKEYDRIEYNLLDTEQKFDEIQHDILNNFKDEINGQRFTHISEVVNYINSQYNELEQKVSEIENNLKTFNKDINKDDLIEQLKDLDNDLNNIVEEHSLLDLFDNIHKLEEQLMIHNKLK